MNRDTTAILLVAGRGDRLSPLTDEVPKALLPIGEQSILERMIRQLSAQGVRHFIIVTGYESLKVRNHVESLSLSCQIEWVTNDVYESSGTAMSAMLAGLSWEGSHLEGDVLLIDGDIVGDDSFWGPVVDSSGLSLFFEVKAISSPEEMKVGEREGRLYLAKGIENRESIGEFVGVARMGATSAREFFRVLQEEIQPAAYYEEALNRVMEEGPYLSALKEVVAGTWIEVDFVTDYLEAVRRFSGGASVVGVPQVSEQVLLCPGPVMVSKRVKQALLHADIGHRESEFIEILTRTRQKLNRVFGVTTSEYTNVILTGSGTAANESVLSTYGTGRRILIVTNGEFGNRLVDMARCHGVDFVHLDFGWTHRIRVEAVAARINEERDVGHPIDAVYMVHHETSTGMLNPLFEMGEMLQQQGVDFLVDAVSSLGAEAVDVERAHVTFCTASANKAIASLPGLAFVCGKRAAFEALQDQVPRTRYLDLYRHYEFEDLHHQTPNTPAVSLFYALETALDELLEDSLEKRMDHFAELSSLIRSRLSEMGMEFVIETQDMSRVLSTVYYPDGMNVEAFHEWIKANNYVIYRGKGPLLGRAFQVANIGHVTVVQVDNFLSMLETWVQKAVVQ